MKIHIIPQRATEKEIREMLEELKTCIKSAIDVERSMRPRERVLEVA